MKKTFCKKRPDKSSLHHRPAMPALWLYRKPALPALCLILCLVLAGCASKAGPGEGAGTSVTKEAGAADAEAVSGSGTGKGVQAVDAEAAAAGGTEAGARAAAGNGTGKDADAADGTYVPASFKAEGGTGKVKISCSEVTVSEGKAQALITFSSPHYEWVKVDGVQYDPENAQDRDRDSSVFRIPVVLEEDMEIIGLTTAMSEPHEITYTIRISLREGGDASDGATAAGAGMTAAGDEKTAAGAGKTAAVAEEAENTDGEDSAGRTADPGKGQAAKAPALKGLTLVDTMDRSYAETFDIFTYEGEDGSQFRLIDIHDSASYLLVPEGAQAPADLPAEITLLRQPLDDIYVAATSSMALFDAAGALDQVKLTGTDRSGWYIDAPKKALEEGKMTYAGKYSAPDYELLLASGCDLAVESMMILHAPEVREKLEELGIPVLIDTSSTESHPLGRTEWVRLYGVLTGHEAEAEAFFEEQKENFAAAEGYEKTGKTVAFFSITSTGNVIVRASDDYIPEMIELAGGSYIFNDLLSKNGSSASVRLSMEDFYNTARDADYLVYNATIEQPVRSIDALCGQSSLFRDFEAVKNGNVWQVQRSLYQSPDIAARMITDFHAMLTGEGADGMTFLEKLQ